MLIIDGTSPFDPNHPYLNQMAHWCLGLPYKTSSLANYDILGRIPYGYPAGGTGTREPLGEIWGFSAPYFKSATSQINRMQTSVGGWNHFPSLPWTQACSVVFANIDGHRGLFAYTYLVSNINYNGVMFDFTSGKIALCDQSQTTAQTIVPGLTTPQIGVPYRILAVYRSATQRELWVNGVLEATSTLNLTPIYANAFYATGGIGTTAATYYHDGLVGNYCRWARGLTEAEILQDFEFVQRSYDAHDGPLNFLSGISYFFGSGGSPVTITPTELPLSANLQNPSILIQQRFAADPLLSTASLPATATLIRQLIAPTPLASTATVPDPATLIAQRVQADPLLTVASIPTPDVGGSQTILASPLLGVVSLQSAQVLIRQRVQPTPLLAVASNLDPQVRIGSRVAVSQLEVQASVLTADLSIGTRLLVESLVVLSTVNGVTVSIASNQPTVLPESFVLRFPEIQTVFRFPEIQTAFRFPTSRRW